MGELRPRGGNSREENEKLFEDLPETNRQLAVIEQLTNMYWDAVNNPRDNTKTDNFIRKLIDIIENDKKDALAIMATGIMAMSIISGKKGK